MALLSDESLAVDGLDLLADRERLVLLEALEDRTVVWTYQLVLERQPSAGW